MIEEADRITALRPAHKIPRLALGVPVLTRSRPLGFLGREVVEAVEIERDGRRERLACDAVVITGRFVPEAALPRASHLEIDEGSGEPVIDQHWRYSGPTYFAAGNLLRPVETSGVVGREGEAAGRAMAAALAGRLFAPTHRVPIVASAPLRFVTPQVIAVPGDRPNGLLFHTRVDRPARNAEVAGRAITRVLSYMIAPYLESGVLEIVLEDYEPRPVPIHVLHKEPGQTSARVRAVVDHVVQHLQRSPALAR